MPSYDDIYYHDGPGYQTCAYCELPGKYLELHNEVHYHRMCWNIVQEIEHGK